MINAILIDDEFFFRESLILTFPWGDYDIHLCGDANNGNDGLELLKQYKPQLALVDINMPEINGLQFIKMGKELSPNTKYIIISGYSEFSYAQEAVDLGVVKYLLKPLRHENLKNALETALKQISSDAQETHRFEELHQQNSYYLTLLRAQFLSQLITYGTRRLFQSPKHSFQLLQLPWEKKQYFYVILCGIVKQEQENTSISNYEQLLNFLQKNLSLPYDGLVCKTSEGPIALMFTSETPLSSNEIYSELLKIQLYLENELHLQFHFAVSPSVNDLNQLPYATTLALETFLNRRLGDSVSIRFYEQETPYLSDLESIISQAMPLSVLIRTGKEEEIRNFFNNMETVFLPACSPEELALAYLHYLRNFLLTAEEQHASVLCKELAQEIKSLKNTIPAEEFIAKLTSWSSLLLGVFNNSPSFRYTPLTEKTIAYIQEHFQMPELTVEIISKHLHVNYAYLCSTFKQDTHTTINKYIKQFRLEKARELLENSDDTITEIALNTGFQTTNYFGKCFKKEYGISPSEYLYSFRK